MVITGVGAFLAPSISASSNGQSSKAKNAQIEGGRNKASSNIVPLSRRLQLQRRPQTLKPLEADRLDFKPPERKEPAQKAKIQFPDQRSGPAGQKKKAQATDLTRAVTLQKPGGPACNPTASIDQEPHPDCGLSPADAKLLAQSAIEGKHFPGRKLLMGKIKTPWDILTADRAIAKALDEANVGASPKQVKAQQMRALFLRDNVGQCVINQAMQTWHGKRVMAAYVLKVLPSEMNPKIPAVRSLAGDGQLMREDARLLADRFILKQPLKNHAQKLEQVIGFKDLVVLEGVAIEALAEATENAKTPQARAELAMNFLFLLHDVGTQTANRIMTERADRVAYMKHMVKSLMVG
ncbi:hypothetical protein [Vampirovibrio sp.]|uniref:hypothetical protein n=1 Tax=Vampirovibrio sp. TaxID=2717857 RepID=UPI0035932CF4